MSILRFYFGWFTGAVWSNLIASLICVGVAWWRIHAQAAKHHAVTIAQAARHHHERLKQADEHHEALKAHVTATAAQGAAPVVSMPAPPPAPKKAAGKRLATKAERGSKGGLTGEPCD